MQMKKKSLNALLALGLAFTQTMAMADSNVEPIAFQSTFQTVASYVTENSDGSVSLQIPEEVAATLDQEVYAELVNALALHNAEVTTSDTTANQDQLRIPFAKKLIIIGLKHGGPVMKKILSKVSPKAGDWLGKNVNKLVEFLEALDNWAELPIATFLMKNGVPPNDAKMMAEIIVMLL